MQITLNQDEIVEAIEAYVRRQITISPSQDIAIDLRAGRGENGFTATLDIRNRSHLKGVPTNFPAEGYGETLEPAPVFVAAVTSEPDGGENIPTQAEAAVETSAKTVTEVAVEEKPTSLFSKAKKKPEPEAESAEAEARAEVVTEAAPKKLFNFAAPQSA